MKEPKWHTRFGENVLLKMLYSTTGNNDPLNSQEHCTDRVIGFPIWKLILVPLITFFGNFATFFGYNFLLLQRFLISIRKLLLDKVILLSR